MRLRTTLLAAAAFAGVLAGTVAVPAQALDNGLALVGSALAGRGPG